MEGVRSAPWLCALLALAPVVGVAANELQIGIIDFYGLRKLSAQKARQALTFREGDTIESGAPSPALRESAQKLEALRGVAHAKAITVCCDNGKAIIYVGIEEKGARIIPFRDAPQGSERLPEDIVQAGDEFSRALSAAVEAGNAGEDDSEGHALARDPAMRAPQEAFIMYAQYEAELLRQVLRNSSHTLHRALAAQVIGYVPDKQSVVDDLVYGMTDPDGTVRNNSMRTLLVFARATPTPTRQPIRIPYGPFIEFLDSPEWTDRNKASAALLELTSSADAELLASLRRDALVPLTEMARWRSDEHAFPSFVILARIAGYSDDELRTAWRKGEREKVIRAAGRAKPPRKPVKRRN
jgi:hypothetical protein